MGGVHVMAYRQEELVAEIIEKPGCCRAPRTMCPTLVAMRAHRRPSHSTRQ